MFKAGSVSAGILLYRIGAGVEFLIAHPGGPYWQNRDRGAWSIPKGLVRSGEEPVDAALREFREETGLLVPAEDLVSLGSIRLASGKVVLAWGAEGDASVEDLVSNTFTLEWPPGSGRVQEFPEMDRYLWAGVDAARERLNRAQGPFLDRVLAVVHGE